ncbi:hypothetical protein SLEP1_g45790 [Rubroshorea leprosula]|uniref:Uncharacterized protein n=1 Tax=Rubroshorea leprosula TaxID=152421 RepID=A0AAV5LKZ6_9ROSI|nr:hypothetical protein SLEP1_g45790 [Rubroshorea leprosula]
MNGVAAEAMLMMIVSRRLRGNSSNRQRSFSSRDWLRWPADHTVIGFRNLTNIWLI